MKHYISTGVSYNNNNYKKESSIDSLKDICFLVRQGFLSLPFLFSRIFECKTYCYEIGGLGA
jgi:hypothetical protein